jgi:membrane protein DedA with SNARE-associated domain
MDKILNIIKPNIIKLIGAFVWAAIFQGLANYFQNEILWYIGSIGLTYLIGTVIVLIIFAWIINPIRDYKMKKKKN